MRVKIASWNVNSLRVRLPQVLEWLQREQPDVLGLQETKVTDDLFPAAALHEAGYQVVFAGQKTYNGVALLSKKALTDVVTTISHINPEEKRVIGGSLGGLRIWNIYVPNGESVTSEKYPYKLAWLDHLKKFLEQELKEHPQLLVMGDFNIAPEAQDVHNPQRWEGQVLFSEPERARLHALLDLGLSDSFRLHPQAEKSFSWWDYRLNAFQRNMGLRIDLLLSSKALAAKCKSSTIDKAARGAERPSDHAPVIAEFDI